MKKCMAYMAAAALLAAAVALTGCQAYSSVSSAAEEEDEASLNRAYMAQLEQSMTDIRTELEAFQDDVSENDVVGMRASVQAVDKIVQEVRDAEPTDTLSDVKDAYVEGLATLDAALGDYVQLYADVSAGSVDDASYQSRLASVQEAYDAGIAQLNDADELVKGLTENDE